MCKKSILSRYNLIPFLFLSFLFSCNSDNVNSDTITDEITDEIIVEPIEYFGNTQGTTFSLICNDPIEITRDEIVSILADFDNALSSYIDSSTLSRLNTMTAGEFSYTDEFDYFNRCYQLSQEVFKKTNGAFDPTVYPLVDGWGFMKNVENVPDSVIIDSLRALVGFQNGYHFNFIQKVTGQDSIPASLIIKNTPHAKLDFNAIAQGLSVDVLAEELEKRGAVNYFVEIGGEIRVHGLNADSVLWRIGIDKPIENSNANNRSIQEIVTLDNKSIATSGSYRKFYEKDGIKYSHTLNPKTGYPVKHSLLSATVIANTCAMADAMATAFMVMGPDKSISFIKNNPQIDIDVYFIFINEFDQYETFYTKKFGEMIVL